MLFLYIAPFYDSDPDKQPFAATRLTLSSDNVPSGNCDFSMPCPLLLFSEKQHPTDSQCLSECGLVGPVTRCSIDLFSNLSGRHGNGLRIWGLEGPEGLCRLR